MFVRPDLSIPQQIVQSCHAILEVGKSLIPDDLPHPHLVVIGIPDERRLFQCVERLRCRNVPCRVFHEPDRAGELTAVATGPIVGAERRHFKRYCCLEEPDFG